MTKYIKIIDGLSIIKPLKSIIIFKQGKQIIAPTEEMVFEDGWSIYKEPQTENTFIGDTIDIERQILLDKIDNYDSSKSVNNCIINYKGTSINYWATKLERSSLKTAVQDYVVMGKEEYRLDLREIGVYVSINCQQLLYMLSALEVYAINCYNKTTDHIFAAKTLQTIEEIKGYDYTAGYPEMLVFNI